MNLNGDEKRIERLFREMSREDELRAPEFASVLNGAGTTRERSWSVAFAGGLAMMVLAAVIALLILPRTTKPVDTPRPDDRAVTSPAPQRVPQQEPLVDERATPKPAGPVKRVRPGRAPDQLANVMKSLSAWRSPTASLLKSPGEEMLKSLPRLGESLETMRSLSTDQLN